MQVPLHEWCHREKPILSRIEAKEVATSCWDGMGTVRWRARSLKKSLQKFLFFLLTLTLLLFLTWLRVLVFWNFLGLSLGGCLLTSEQNEGCLPEWCRQPWPWAPNAESSSKVLLPCLEFKDDICLLELSWELHDQMCVRVSTGAYKCKIS